MEKLYLSLLFVALAVLIKLPVLYLGLPLLYLSVNKFGKTFLANPKIWIYAALVFIPAMLWYYHAHQLFLRFRGYRSASGMPVKGSGE